MTTRRLVVAVKLPKPLDQITDCERREFVNQLVAEIAARMRQNG